VRKELLIIKKNNMKFCPSCHKRIELPQGFEKINVIGNLNITCGNCKKVVIIKDNLTKVK